MPVSDFNAFLPLEAINPKSLPEDLDRVVLREAKRIYQRVDASAAVIRVSLSLRMYVGIDRRDQYFAVQGQHGKVRVDFLQGLHPLGRVSDFSYLFDEQSFREVYEEGKKLHSGGPTDLVVAVNENVNIMNTNPFIEAKSVSPSNYGVSAPALWAWNFCEPNDAPAYVTKLIEYSHKLKTVYRAMHEDISERRHSKNKRK